MLFRKKYVWAVVFTVFLTAFTVYIVLDTFFIARVYTVVEASSVTVSGQTTDTAVTETVKNEDDGETEEAAAAEATVLDSYSDENLQITVYEYRIDNTSVYVADVTAASASYLKTAFAQNAYGRNVTETTSEIASGEGAILAVNGDFYGSRESGYVIRNGVLYRDTAGTSQEDLVIYGDGSFEIVSEDAVSAEDLLSAGASQVLSFGPGLVEDGSISVTEADEVGKAKASNPRTAVGVIDDLHYVFVVSDGRTDESEGLSLYQLAEFMKSLGVTDAYNLDGGGSSTMYFKGQVINNPTTDGRNIEERSVSDIVYIGY